jgi:hypothetical protein
MSPRRALELARVLRSDGGMENSTKTKPVLIACPQYRRYVRGVYLCDRAGATALTDGGTISLAHVQCGQEGGRCAQTLCVLHRYNRRGAGSWFPESVRFAPRHS